MRRRTYSTGQVALSLDIAPRTVCELIDAGKLRGYRIPTAKNGAGDRRVTYESLADFAVKHGIPFDEINPHGGVVLLGLPDSLESAVYAALADTPSFAVQTWVEAGQVIERRKPSSIVVDAAIGRAECLASIRALRADMRLAGLRIVVLVSADDGDFEGWYTAGATLCLAPPVMGRAVVEATNGKDATP